MADIKTHLRELSVAFSFCENSINYLTPSEFLITCKEKVQGTDKLDLEDISHSTLRFDKTELDIINRGIELGKKIREFVLKNQSISLIKWTGGKTQSGSAVDLIINDIEFSLKEESHILQNMGLYQYLNLILDNVVYNRGVHCFEDFALEELNLWYKSTRNSVIRGLVKPFVLEKNNNISFAELINNDLQLKFNDKTKVIKNFNNSNYETFKESLNGQLKEKVFSKMVKKYCESDETYLTAKKNCAKKAGENIVKLLESRIGGHPNIEQWFRIADKKYYYCKITDDLMQILKVPDKTTFTNSIIIKHIEWSVPKHQLNIITTLKNTVNQKVFKFRNECRYSHGQLNGTPESKSYYIGDSLEFAYDRIY